MTDPRAPEPIAWLDHPVLATRDLAAARGACERLGFTVPPRGSHVEWGTGNLCVMFPNDYLELRGVIDPSRPTIGLEDHLERFGEGLMGIAFGTRDVERSRRELARRGVPVGPVRRLARNFEHPEGWTQPAFALCVPEPPAIEGLMHVVVLEHLTPELIRRPEFLIHPNGCTGVDEVCGIIPEAASVAARMAALFGPGAVATTDAGVRITLPTRQRVELLLPGPYRKRFGANGEFTDATVPRLGAMTLRVEDLARTGDVLDGNGVRVTESDRGRLRLGPAEGLGTIIEFTASGAG